MKSKKRKPSHPGCVLEEHYIKPLNLDLQDLAYQLGITLNALFEIISGKARINRTLASALAEAFDTTPQLWLNLQENYDQWSDKPS